ncbi:hypothetical protein CRM22_001905 [Opisthorchis felineus]|uniref:Uncharacterized protein n=1 Tax=Opisthorchis felineus TaxID=147828 RepID=A0A4S2M8J6_OPIFE|nr:hypothetical protein CRM22_001905 [Opisthorchis felineus]
MARPYLLIPLVAICSAEIFERAINSDKDDSYIKNFLFSSKNSSFSFELVYMETFHPMRLRMFWDSPIAWVDSYNMRLTCQKRQEILQRLSPGQLIHLDPRLNSWCSTMTLSPSIMRELSLMDPNQSANRDWSTVLASILLRLSGAVATSLEWLNPFGTFYDSISSETMHAANQTWSGPGQPPRIPDLLRTVYESHLLAVGLSRAEEMHNWVYCKSPEMQFQFTRPVWWFFSLERCPAESEESFYAQDSRLKQSGLQARYRLTSRNGLEGDLFHGHFSAQKFDHLFRLHRLHPTVYLWLCSIGSRSFAQIIRLICTFQFAVTGIYSQALAVISQLLYSTSMSTLFASLLLLSSGYSVVHHVFTRVVAIVLLLLLICYTLTNACCQVAIELVQDRGDILSRYHSPPAYVFVALQIMAAIGFWLSTSYTIVHWTEKRLFFIRLGAFYSAWFLNTPFWTFITVELSHKPYTETMIRIWDEAVSIGAYIGLLLLIRPSNANMVFPLSTSEPGESVSRETVLEPVPTPKPVKKTTGKSTQTKHNEPAGTSQPPKTTSRAHTAKPKTPFTSTEKLFSLTGKPGDLTPPSQSLARNLPGIGSEQPKRPQTTPSAIRITTTPRP